MQRLLNKILVFISIGYAAHPAYGACVAVPEHAVDAPVHVCESASTYSFDIVGTKYEYDKFEYRAALSELLHAWMDGAAVPMHVRHGVRVALWVSVPEANPAATGARAVIYAPGYEFVAYISIHPDEWVLTGRDVGVLGKDRYPTSFGYRAGSLVVQTAQPGIDPSDFLHAFGMTMSSAMGGGWYGYDLAPFAEESTKKAVLGDEEGARLVKRIEVDSIFEWIAWRRQGFVFALAGD